MTNEKIAKDTVLYSMVNYNADGFPEEIKVKKVVGNIVYHKGGQITLPTVVWTTDWMTSLLAWNNPKAGL